MPPHSPSHDSEASVPPQTRGPVAFFALGLVAFLVIPSATGSAPGLSVGPGETPLATVLTIMVSRSSPSEAGVVGYADGPGLPIDVLVNGVVVASGVVGWTGEYWFAHVPVSDGASVFTRIALLTSPTVTVPAYAASPVGPPGFIYADGTRLMRNGAPIELFGVDDNTVFSYALLTWGYGQTQFAGNNQNFPSGPETNIPGVVTPDDLWREYFRYFLHYQQNPTADSPRANLFRVWVVDNNFGPYAYEVWESNPALFYEIFDKMLYWAARAGVFVVPILGQHHIPPNNAFYDRTSPEYARHIAFARGVIAHYDAAPEIAMWDLWNEADVDNDAYWLTVGGIGGYRAWLTGLVGDLRSSSQNHLFTVGTCQWDAMPGLPSAFGVRKFFLFNDIPGIDVAHEHVYSSAEDQYLVDWQTEWGAALGRPYYIGELGYNGVNLNGLGYGHWPWFTRQWRAGGAGPITEMVWLDNGKGPYADYPYLGPLPSYPSSSFDFSLSVNPPSGTVAPGQSASTSASTVLTSGASQSVDFSATGLPSGAIASFNPTACSPSCTSTLTVSTSPTTPTGTYAVAVSATGGGLTRTTSYSLTVSNPCPASPASYPSTSWDRVWCDASFTGKLADGPDEPMEEFDTDWLRGNLGGIRPDDIGFRSGRTITIPITGDYRFTVGADDGVRVWIDGTSILDAWIVQPYTTYNVTCSLTVGSHQVRLDYYEGLFDARLSFTYVLTSAPDMTAPSRVTDLRAPSTTTQGVTLQWTAPGDDGSSGTAASYELRYSTLGPLNDTNFPLATLASTPAPSAPGLTETVTVNGLSAGTRHWFALRTADEVPNWSPLSNVADGTTSVPPPPPDQTAPARVTDLNLTSFGTDRADLRWTAPGDDGMSGTATAYQIRYSASGPLTESNFASAIPVVPPTPAAAWTAESWSIPGLAAGTRYWVGLRTGDEVPNWSPLSNVVEFVTAVPPPPPPDTTPPTVGFAAPAEGATVSGLTTISVFASDDAAVASVSLYVDGALQGTDVAVPYAWTWDASAAPEGTHGFKAVAIDSSGNRANATRNVVVPSSGIDPPRVSAAMWDPVQNRLEVTFSKSMNHGSVEANLGLAPSAPYTMQWEGDARLFVVLGDEAVREQAYVVTIGQQAQDATGVPMSAPFTFGFRSTAVRSSASPSPVVWVFAALAASGVLVGTIGGVRWWRRRRVRILREAMSDLSEILEANDIFV